MALINCPESGCSAQVSTSATQCPKCGADIQKYLNTFRIVSCPRCGKEHRVKNPWPDSKVKEVRTYKHMFQYYPFKIPSIDESCFCTGCDKSMCVCWYYV